MAYLLLGILVIGIVASIAVAFLSARTWPIYQVVLVVFVFLGAVVFFYLGARTLATHKAWRDLVRQRESELAQLESQTVPLVGGVDAQGHSVPGTIPQLQHELAMMASARGGVYYNVKANRIADGVVYVTLTPQGPPPPAPEAGMPGQPIPEQPIPEQPIPEQPIPEQPIPEQPVPGEPVPEQPVGEQPAAGEAAEKEAFAHGLDVNSVVYAFDQKPVSEGGWYLGEFKVKAASKGSPDVQLTPNLPLTEAQTKRLDAAVAGTWTLYTTMPVDDPAVFATLDDAARQGLLPADRVDEYAQLDRSLRDYQAFFHENYVQRSLLSDAISKTTTNIERTNAATGEVKNEIGYRETEKTNLTTDLERFQSEVNAIASYQKSVEGELTKVRAARREAYIENRRSALAIERDQFEDAAEIDRRSEAAASSPR